MMQPIFFTSRCDVSNWLAYVPPANSNYVLFDGGYDRETTQGFWSLDLRDFGDEISNVPDSFVDSLPKIPMAGYLTSDNILHVTGFPTYSQAATFCIPEGVEYPVCTEVEEEMLFAVGAFIEAPSILTGESCHFITIQPLPSDRAAASKAFRKMGTKAFAMSPFCDWTDHRSRMLVSNKRPTYSKECKVLAVNYDDFDVQFTPTDVRKTRLLYEDDLPESNPMKVGDTVRVYYQQNQILGYK